MRFSRRAANRDKITDISQEEFPIAKRLRSSDSIIPNSEETIPTSIQIATVQTKNAKHFKNITCTETSKYLLPPEKQNISILLKKNSQNQT